MWRRVPWAASLFLAVLLASVSDTQAQCTGAATGTTFSDFAATQGGTPFANAGEWIASCPAGTAGCLNTAYCIKTGGCEAPCNSPDGALAPECPNDGQSGGASSQCIAGMYCGWWMTGTRSEDEDPGEPSGRLCARDMGLADARA